MNGKSSLRPLFCRRTLILIFNSLVVMAVHSQSLAASTITLNAGSDLQQAIDQSANGDTLILAAADFEARSQTFKDPLCGNCQNPRTDVSASYGIIVKDKSLTIIGADREKSRIITNAGYGLYFENSRASEVHNITITGGNRNDDGNATDAAIVVRSSRVVISDCDIRDNTDRSDDSTVVVGIGGIFGREGAELIISGCRIQNNGWDGIALYRGATAIVTDCFIKDGRGAGIGVTWDATCVALRNEITGFWKGIGSFGTASVIARNNLVFDCLGWGMVAAGQSTMEATNNVIHHNGNCGFAPWSTEARGRFINNIVDENGWRDQWVCPCVGVWNYGDFGEWVFRNNIVWNNRDGEYEDIWDQTGSNGNLNVDPKFLGARKDTTENLSARQFQSFFLTDDSPARHAGDSTIFNLDGTISNIGLTGGPSAR